MSARAAWRLESLGFARVFRYVAGKEDWFAFGLPMEGAAAGLPNAGDVMRRDVPTCHWAERLGEVRKRVAALNHHNVCLVVNEAGVVLGRLRGKTWNADPNATVESVMENGPTTFRPDTLLAPLVERMQEKNVAEVIITNSDGVLMGVMDRQEAEVQVVES